MRLHEKPSCDVCHALQSNPDCDTCLPPLKQENLEVFRVYMAVRNQHIVGFDGPIDLDLNALFCIMNIFNVVNKKDCYKRVHDLYHKIIEKMKDS